MVQPPLNCWFFIIFQPLPIYVFSLSSVMNKKIKILNGEAINCTWTFWKLIQVLNQNPNHQVQACTSCCTLGNLSQSYFLHWITFSIPLLFISTGFLCSVLMSHIPKEKEVQAFTFFMFLWTIKIGKMYGTQSHTLSTLQGINFSKSPKPFVNKKKRTQS